MSHADIIAFLSTSLRSPIVHRRQANVIEISGMTRNVFPSCAEDKTGSDSMAS